MQPTELASSQSPPLLIRIPSTGDLLCVWNQASGEEIRRGYLRGRLSSAISRDNGMTWEHFKTIERHEGLDKADRITPEFPIPGIARGRFGLGQLIDGLAKFTYPNVDIIGETVFLRYSRSWPRTRDPREEDTAPDRHPPMMWSRTAGFYENRRAEMTGEAVMRRYPLAWFYE